MKVIRPIKEADLEAYEKFAQTVGVGVTSLPKNHNALRARIQQSVTTFANSNGKGDGLYIFVLDDIQANQLGGTCAINARTRGSESGYFYRVEELVKPKTKLRLGKERRLLQPVQKQHYASEVAGLYLSPKYRKLGVGKLLSLSRFLFIAAFPDSFHERVIVELRGRIEKGCYSPFWEAVGRRFIDLSFKDIMREFANDPSFVSLIIPSFPIYAALLPQEARKAIGKTHANTRAALNMLSEQGFQPTGDIDIFDGGPKLAALATQIRSVAQSKRAQVKAIKGTPVKGIEAIISNESRDYRAIHDVVGEAPGGGIALSDEAADALGVSPGDTIRYLLT